MTVSDNLKHLSLSDLDCRRNLALRFRPLQRIQNELSKFSVAPLYSQENSFKKSQLFPVIASQLYALARRLPFGRLKYDRMACLKRKNENTVPVPKNFLSFLIPY